MPSEKSKAEASLEPLPDGVPEEMRVLMEAVGRERRMHFIYAVATLLVGLGFLSADLYGILNELPPRVIYRAFGIMGLGITAVLLWKSRSLRDPFRTPFVRMIRETPGEILWFYELRSNSMFATLPFIRLHMRDGDSLQMSVPPKKAREALELVERIAPHAIRGYSKENEKDYLELISMEKDAKA